MFSALPPASQRMRVRRRQRAVPRCRPRIQRGPWRALSYIVGLVIAQAVSLGCGADQPPVMGDSPNPTLRSVVAANQCPEGQTRSCRRLISEHSGVVTCSAGSQACTGGVWTPCGGTPQGTITFQRAKLSPTSATQVLATPAAIPAPEIVRLSSPPGAR
jgi:hypothetical protein